MERRTASDGRADLVPPTAGTTVADGPRSDLGDWLGGHGDFGADDLCVRRRGGIGNGVAVDGGRGECGPRRRRIVVLPDAVTGGSADAVVESLVDRRRFGTVAGDGRHPAVALGPLGDRRRRGLGPPLVLCRIHAGHGGRCLDAYAVVVECRPATLAWLGSSSPAVEQRCPPGVLADRRPSRRVVDDPRCRSPTERVACRPTECGQRVRPDGADGLVRRAAAGTGCGTGGACDPRAEGGLYAGGFGVAAIRRLPGLCPANSDGFAGISRRAVAMERRRVGRLRRGLAGAAALDTSGGRGRHGL